MSSKRSYQDSCAGAHALDLIGERWALLIVRELLLGPKRFTDLRAGLPGISANVLSQRLDELIASGVAERRKLPPPYGSQVYDLTAWGRELETVIVELGRWGARSPALPRDAPLSVDSLMLSFRTMFDAGAAKGAKLRIAFRIGDDAFRAIVANRTLDVVRGDLADPDARVESDTSTLAALAYNGVSLATALRQRRLRIDGDRRSLETFIGLFSLPERACAPRH